MRTKLFAVLGDGIALIAAVGFVVSVPAFAQSWMEKAVPPFAVTAANPHLPAGAKLVGRVRLDGRPVTHMYIYVHSVGVRPYVSVHRTRPVFLYDSRHQ